MEKNKIVRILCAVALFSLFGRMAADPQAAWIVAAALPVAVWALGPSRRMAFAAADAPQPDLQRQLGDDRDAAPTPHDDRPLVLVAEDNAGNYRLIEVILRHAYRLQHALTGQEAVELFDRERPDMVLMDINMPVMDGYEALRLIRERDLEVPVIALTAYAFDSDLQKMLECGFNACMTKPINVGGIKALIESHLRK